MNTFLKTLSVFVDDPDAVIPKEEWAENTILLSSINQFNKDERGYTSIAINGGERWCVAIKYEEFVELMQSHATIIEKVDKKAKYEYGDQGK